MSDYKRPRCGRQVRGGTTCGRPAGHSGKHLSEEVYQRGLIRVSARRRAGLTEVATHGYGGYSAGCRCEICRAAKSGYMAERRAQAYVTDTSPENDPSVTHGTRFAYEERGCRCDECVTNERISSRWTRKEAAA